MIRALNEITASLFKALDQLFYSFGLFTFITYEINTNHLGRKLLGKFAIFFHLFTIFIILLILIFKNTNFNI